MDLISLEAMLRASSAGRSTPQACAEVLAAGLPPSSKVARAVEILATVSPNARRRALTRPLAAARLTAMRAKCGKASEAEPYAWGVVAAGNETGYSLAARINGVWWARTARGLAKVHPSRAVACWRVT